jgi:hypothetical protein
MFWHKKKTANNGMQLYVFNFSIGYYYVSGLAPERIGLEMNDHIVRLRNDAMCTLSPAWKTYWNYACIYESELPFPIPLSEMRKRCYQHPEELKKFLDAGRACRKAALSDPQGKLYHHWRALEDAKNDLIRAVFSDE